ncbi:MAG: DNA cytosine methyltransferase [Clostridiaceae bacterium]|nr:DNA cytosine methyltransferase [Clostridiaceae bacterium]
MDKESRKLTYISLFSSAGVGCYGFNQAGFECIATNEIIERRLNIQRINRKCKYESGYIKGDATLPETKKQILDEIEKWRKEGYDTVDVVIATPPCQGMSVANHKKSDNEIVRNSLVVESILITKQIKSRFFIFENVASFMKTGCTAPDGTIKEIGKVIYEELGNDYIITSRTLNLKNYGSNSSRTRTVVIGVHKSLAEHIAPVELYPAFQEEKTLDRLYQYFCLVAKVDNIREYLTNDELPTIYNFRDFIYVLEVGLETEEFKTISDMDFDAVLKKIDYLYNA